MSGKGNRYDDAPAKSFVKTPKAEPKVRASKMVWRTIAYIRTQARDAVSRYVDAFYNPVRRHPTPDCTSSIAFPHQAA